MLHGLVATQVKQAIFINVDINACRTVAAQGILEPGLGKLRDALQILEGSGQSQVGTTTAHLAGSQCLAQPWCNPVLPCIRTPQ